MAAAVAPSVTTERHIDRLVAAGRASGRLDLSRDYLGDRAVRHLMAALAQAEGVRLTELNLRSVGLKAEGLAAVFDFLESPNGASVTTLILDDNPFLAVTAGVTAATRVGNTQLRMCSMRDTNIPAVYEHRVEAAVTQRV